MTYLLFLFLFSSQTLSPPPVDFTREVFSVGDRTYVVRNMGNRVTIAEKETLYQAFERQHLKEYLRELYGDFVEEPGVTIKPLGCCASGCLLVVVFVFVTVASALFFYFVEPEV